MFAQQPLDRHVPIDADLRGAWLGRSVAHRNLGVDASPAGDDMTPVNPTDITAERVGADFGGTNGYLRRAEADWRSGDSAGTILAWIRKDGVGTQVIFSSCDEAATNNVFYLSFAGDDLLFTARGADTVFNEVVSPNIITYGVWHRVAVSSNGTAWQLYVDGVPVTTSVNAGSNTGQWLADITLRDSVLIGARRRLVADLFWAGQIKDVQYLSRELSADEILYDYRQCVPDPDLRLWLPWGDRDYTRFEWPLTHGGGVVVGHRQLFDGTDDFIDCGDIGLISQVSMWIDPESTTEQILQIDAGKHVVVNAGTVTYTGLTAAVTYVDGVASTTLAADVWQHLVCQFTQDDADNFELGREGANYGEIDLWNVRAHDRLWGAAEVATMAARERRAL